MALLNSERRAKDWLTGLIATYSASIVNGYWDSQRKTIHVWVTAGWLPLLRKTLPSSIDGFPVEVSEMPEFTAQIASS